MGAPSRRIAPVPGVAQQRPRIEIGEWILNAGLAGDDEIAILTGVCERLTDAGIALVRSSVANDLLDPTFDGRGVRWVRGQGGVEESFVRIDDAVSNENWTRSPFFALLESAQPMLRRRLDATHRRDEMPLLDGFQDDGVTDYVAFSSRCGEGLQLGETRGIVASWTTDAPRGFTQGQIETLAGIMPALAMVFLLRTTHRTARTLITTYLGSDAAERVLAGNIVRGRAEPIRAVVWFSDLVGFTRIADDAASADTVLELLNDYAEAQVEEIEANGGHVLKFIGDGILAIFPHDDMTEGCMCALRAAAGQRHRIGALNARRSASGLPVTDTHVALHVGELLYGNLGSARRLDFTVLGPAVNVAARIEALCLSLEQRVIVSSAFAEAAGDASRLLVSLGRYAMKGVARPQELFTLDIG
jgi:adenylate cyclase